MENNEIQFKFSVGDTVQFSFNHGTFKVTKCFVGPSEEGEIGPMYTIKNSNSEFERVEESELIPLA